MRREVGIWYDQPTMTQSNAKQNVVPLLFHAADPNGDPTTTYAGMLSLDDGSLMLMDLSNGQAISVPVEHVPVIKGLLDSALDQYKNVHVVSEPADVEADPVEPAPPMEQAESLPDLPTEQEADKKKPIVRRAR